MSDKDKVIKAMSQEQAKEHVARMIQARMIIIAARVAHEVNRAYCEIVGDHVHPSWNEAPEWQQQSSVGGVAAVVQNPDMTAEQVHESWVAQKELDGWVYGPELDVKQKKHPCMVLYEQLPEEQRAKDKLFRAVVRAIFDTKG